MISISELRAANSNLAGITHDFRESLDKFIDSAREQVGVMNQAFVSNGITGEDDLVSSNRDAFLSNVQQISMHLDRLCGMSEKLKDLEQHYATLTGILGKR